MGKTIPTYRDQVQSFENHWNAFRRALYMEYKDHWDEVVVQAHQHAHAGDQQNPVDEKWGIVFSVLVSQEKRIAELEAQLEVDDGDG